MNTIRPSQRVLHTISRSRCPHIQNACQWRPLLQPRRAITTQASINPSYKPRSKSRPYIWAAVFLAWGWSSAFFGNKLIRIFDDIERDSPQDIALRETIVSAADDISIVKQLRGLTKSWEEVSLAPQEGDTMLNETMAGSVGLMTPRAFWNEKEKELIMVVHYGGSLCGWPGIAHGGCTATVLLEGMGRAVDCFTGNRDASSVRPPDPSELGLTYVKPLQAGLFYLLKAKFVGGEETTLPEMGSSADKDLAKKLEHEQSGITAQLNKKYDIDCTLETLDGRVCMKAKGVWNIL